MATTKKKDQVFCTIIRREIGHNSGTTLKWSLESASLQTRTGQ